MKNFKRAMSVVFTVMLLASGLIAALPVSAAATNYEFNLGLNNIKDDYYEFMAYDVIEKQLLPLETEAKPTWSASWPGHFIVGQNYYVVGKPENASKGTVDLIPRDKYAPAITFTAPADGKYNFVVELFKLYAGKEGATSFVDVMLVRDGTGEVIVKEERLEQGELKWVKKNVELAEGERVFIIVALCADSTRDGGHNVALTSLLVNEAVEQTTPSMTTTPDSTTAPDSTTDDVGNEKATDEFTPIIIVAIVAGALALAAVIVVIVVKAKKKK